MNTLIVFITLCVASVKLDGIVTKQPSEVSLDSNLTNVVSGNISKMRSRYSNNMPVKNNKKIIPKVSEGHQQHLKILYNYLLHLEFVSKSELSNNMELFKRIDTKTGMILLEVFQYRSRYFEDQTNDLHCMLMKMLPKDPTNRDLLNFQQLLISELTSLRKEMKPLMYKYFEVICKDDLMNAESMQRIVDKIRTKTELIILLENVKTFEGKEKTLTVTCSDKRFSPSKVQEEINIYLEIHRNDICQDYSSDSVSEATDAIEENDVLAAKDSDSDDELQPYSIENSAPISAWCLQKWVFIVLGFSLAAPLL